MIDKTQYEYSRTIEQFLQYLTDILQLYRDTVPILKRELKAVIDEDINSLDDSIKSQQAILLRTRNFDEQTTAYLSKLNIKADNLTEMARQLPKDDGLRFFDILGEYELIMTEVGYYKEKCRMLLSSKLYTIDKTLSKLSIQKDNTTYNQNAAGVQGTLFSKSFEKKI
ncbi:MAG: flagellar export chaperone FlgN [Eubacteriales bacterium]|nr:flagellar export chaperone FlgN [Eubacteriales bacterium]MDD3199242.1 flagellar export chaperone FlgN [Eubacteriales bacterium]MDD4121415.1 flagellar export chaperone FlgN [Eubacteriales bacterium]MDD4629373.1 flagellar export chaperone FlgN [Eubacteriales bacterium]